MDKNVEFVAKETEKPLANIDNIQSEINIVEDELNKLKTCLLENITKTNEDSNILESQV